MSERKINLEELAVKYGILKGFSIQSNPVLVEKNFTNFCNEFAKQILELAAENSKIEIKTVGEELTITDIYQEDHYTRIQVNIPSILNTINQVE